MTRKACQGVQLVAVELLAVQVVSVDLLHSKIVKKNWTVGCLMVRMSVYQTFRPVNYRLCAQHHCSEYSDVKPH